MGFIFLGGLIVLAIFNAVYAITTPNVAFNMLLGSITGLLVTFIAVLVAGLLSPNSSAVKLLFGVGVILDLLIYVPISFFGFSTQIGLGLAINLLNMFPDNMFYGIPIIIVSSFCVVMVYDGLQSMLSGGE